MQHYRRAFLAVLFLFSFQGCEEKEKPHFDKKALIVQKCAKCHNLDLPPKTFENEIAPPMMAVAFHVQNFMDVSDESRRIPQAIAFVKEYVLAPSREKSLCDEASLKSYGLMPSQKDNLNEDELQAIAEYMFTYFTQKNLNEAQAIQNRLNSMPKGERLAVQNNCMTCHRVDKHIVGPSLREIAKRYKNEKEHIDRSIKDGSSKIWKNSHGAVMPAFKNLNDQEVKDIREWIFSLLDSKEK